MKIKDIDIAILRELEDGIWIITIEDMENQKPKSKLNRYVRFIYRKLMREYGAEKVREEALRIYCLTTPERARVRKESATMLSTEFIKAILNLCLEWGINPKHFNEALAGTTYFSPEELDEVLLDLTPLRIRIRKLTPRECGRLQGVTDDDITRIEGSGVSNSAQYKLYGNSICVPVLEGIFTQLIRQDSDALF